MQQDDAMRESHTAAEQGLQTLRVFAVRNFAAMGLESGAQASDARVGERGFPIVLIRTDLLREYERGPYPSTFFQETGEAVFPVYVGEVALTSILVAPTSEGMGAVEIGNSELMRAIESANGSAALERNSGAFIARARPLNLDFLGTRRGDEILLAPMFDSGELRFSAGVPMPAAEVFERLAPLARAIDPDQPG
jgi:hypothetical protein